MRSRGERLIRRDRTMSDATVNDQAAPAAEKPGLRWGRIAVWAVVGLVLVFLALGLVNAFASQPTSGKAPDFTLTTFDGEQYRLSDLRGRVVVINFWASWCGPCEEEAPDLQAAWEAYRDEGVMFLGVDYVDSEEKALAYLERFGITYPNGPDLGTRISDLYNIKGVPETFIVNPEGEIVFFAMRPLTYEELSAEIEKALGR